jgi:NAD(P)H-dependent flavin oxidoreductase YrpB (nitropropane dioxygenase family)
VLLPKVVDVCRGHLSPLSGEQVLTVAAGGIFDGRGLAMALAAGAAGVWVGTRFVACDEAGAGPIHRQMLLKASYDDTITTTIYTGRPLRAYRSPFIQDWEFNRRDQIAAALAAGKVPVPYLNEAAGIDPLPTEHTTQQWLDRKGWLMGQCAGAIQEEKSARAIVEDMVSDAVALLHATQAMVVWPLVPAAKL